MTCRHCARAIEPVDNAQATKYRFRHADDKHISCFGMYQPEIATPATAQLEGI